MYSAYRVWLQWQEYSGGSEAYSVLDTYVDLPSDNQKAPEKKDRKTGIETTREAARETPSTMFESPAISETPSILSESPATTEMPTQLLSESAQSVPAESGSTEPPEAVYDYPDIEWPEIDFAQLREINPEIVGWLYLEGTEINYPIVQAEDNQWYLTHLFDGRENKTGCPFLDAENMGDFSDRHSIIYAHHRKDGSMFGRLKLFKKQDYYEEHPRFLVITEHARYVMEIFSGHVSRHDSDAWKIQFADDEEFEAWLKVITERSGIDTGAIPEKTDRILTLSTCSYEFSNARYVLHGILRRAKEPIEK